MKGSVMAGWVLVPCLVQLRSEVNELCPDRDKSSDGTIGDAAHQGRVSDHNDDEVGKVPIRDADSKHEVHAWDMDRDTKSGISAEDIVQHILGRCRSGKERRLRYIIYAERIWEASNGWKLRSYRGSNPHNQHVHFSSSYVSALEADTSNWLEGMGEQKMRANELRLDGLRLPVLKIGDDDNKYGGYNMVWRVQKIVGVSADGIYGNGTAKGIRDFTGGKVDGKKVDLEVWRLILGLSTGV